MKDLVIGVFLAAEWMNKRTASVQLFYSFTEKRIKIEQESKSQKGVMRVPEIAVDSNQLRPGLHRIGKAHSTTTKVGCGLYRDVVFKSGLICGTRLQSWYERCINKNLDVVHSE